MGRSSKLVILAIFIIMAMLALAQNKNPEQTTSGWSLSLGSAPGRVVVAQAHPVLGLDPHTITDSGSALLCANIYQGLVRFKPGSALVEPCLATEWDVSPNGLAWTFKLRPGVTFHDGAPFNAEAVQLNFARHLNRQQDQATGYADFVFAPLDRVEVVDQQTIRLHLKYPYAPLLNNLAMPMAAALVSPGAFGTAGPEKSQNNSYPAGTGPYLWAGEYAGGNLLKANPKYWEGPPRVKEILVTTIPEPDKRAQLLQKGKVHLALDLTSRETDQLQGRDFQVYRATGLDIGYLGFYARKKPFSQPALRQAVALSLDRSQIINELWPRDTRPALGILPPTIPGYREGGGSYNPEQARRLLREAGHGEGFTFTLITYSNPRPYAPGGGEMLARALARSLATVNIKVEVKAYPWEEFKQALARQEGDAFLYGWISDNGDPDNFLHRLLAQSQIQNGQNSTGYHNEQLDALLTSARQTTDPQARRELYHQAQAIIDRDTPWVVLNHSLHQAASSRSITGFTLSPTGWHRLQDLSP